MIDVPGELKRAQRAASDPEASAFVLANAGAGKTEVLTQRVLRLLVRGQRPEKILCLTYTKAAAAEMTERLFARLGEWALMEDGELGARLAELGESANEETLASARRLFARALETPGGLKVLTIHAFCERVLSRFPLEAGVPSPFSVLDERAAGALVREARDLMLRDAAQGKDASLARALSALAAAKDEENFDKALDATLAQRRTLAEALERFGGVEGLTAAIHEALGIAPGDSEAKTRAEAARLPPGDEAQLRAAIQALGQGKTSDTDRAAQLRAFLGAEDRSAAFDEYACAFLSRDWIKKGEVKPIRKTITNDLAEEHPHTAAFLKQEQARVAEACERIAAARAAALSEATIRVALSALSHYEALKRRRGALDFDDLVAKTAALLTRAEAAQWVLYKLDGGVDHVLIDEGQDTNAEQWSVIDSLTEEFCAGRGIERAFARTVFCVGDEKQSIFSFQGALPRAFTGRALSYRERFSQAGFAFRLERFAYSFRSTAPVLRAVDAVFADPELRAAVSESEFCEHIALRETDAGLVEVWSPVAPPEKDEPDPWDAPLDHPQKNAPEIRLAEEIAAEIRQWIAGKARLPSEGRTILPEDVLVLVQTRNAFVTALIRALKRNGVPVAGADRLALTSHIAVMDLMALGRVALFPEDDLTLAALLKSPLCGLDEDELFSLAHGRTGSLWRALESRKGEFAHAYGVIARARARADYAPPFEFYAEFLAQESGRKAIVERLGLEANDPIDEFLNLALAFEREHAASLEAFLAHVAAGAGEIKRDLERGTGAVRVMTVHAAKGLQANIVFVVDNCRVPETRFEAPLWPAPNGAPVWRESKARAAEEIKALRQTEMLREHRRLLYVALTRARDRLYFCSWHGGKGMHAQSWTAKVIPALQPLGKERPRGRGGRPSWQISFPGAARAKQAAKAEAPPPPLPRWVTAKAPPEEPEEPRAPSAVYARSLPPRAPLDEAEEARFLRGRIVHRLLQFLPGRAPDARRDAARRYLSMSAPNLGESEREAIEDTVLHILEHPDFAGVFAAGSLAEIPVAGRIAGEIFSGQIDRLAVRERDVLIVDYKSDRDPPDSVDRIPEAYAAQLAVYAALVKRLYPGKRVRAALLWTAGAQLMEVPAVRLESALAALLDAPDVNGKNAA